MTSSRVMYTLLLVIIAHAQINSAETLISDIFVLFYLNQIICKAIFCFPFN